MRVMSCAMICVLLQAIDQTVVIPALPAIGRDLGAYDGLSWIVAAYLITSTISTPIYAKLSDLYGRRRLLIACIAVFIATSIFCALARSLNQLIWFRALLACRLLLGAKSLVAMDLLAQFANRRSRDVDVPNRITSTAAAHHASKPRLDIIGMLLLAGALSILLLALGWGGTTYAWASWQIMGLVAFGCCLLFLLVKQELRAHDPLLPPRVFMSSSYVASAIIAIVTSSVLFICLFTIPLYFQFVRGATTAQSGIYLAPFMLASAAGNVAGARWAKHSGTMRAEIRIASGICCAGLVMLTFLPMTAPIFVIIVALILTGPGVGGCLIGSTINGQNALSGKDMGSGTGALLVLRSAGGAIGSTLAGAIIACGMVTAQHGAGGTMSAIAHSTQHTSATLAQVAGVAGLSSYFGMVYAAAAGLAFVPFGVSLFMPNVPLRESTHFETIAD